jgi:hypothetical protein
MGGPCSTYGRLGRCIRAFGAGNLGKRDDLEDPGVDGRIILKGIFKKCGGREGTGLIWFRIGTADRLL